MEKKILLQELAERLAANRKISKKQAESFVKCFFEVAEEALLRDKFVKIKGFGTFKVVSVSERESVSVNTGERIQISGHAKVAFTPDTQLRNSVNRPFSHFETIILNDDTDIDEFEKVPEEDIISSDTAASQEEMEESPMPIEETPETPEEPQMLTLPETETETELETEIQTIDEMISSEQNDDPQPEVEPEVEAKTEAEIEVETKTETEKAETETEVEAEVEVETETETEVEDEVEVETEVETESGEPEETNEYEEAIRARAAHTRRVILWSIVTLLLMAGSFALGHYHWLLPCPHTASAITDSTATSSLMPDSTALTDTLSAEKPAMQSASPKSVESAPDSPMESAPKEKLLPSAPQTAPAAP